MEMKHKIESLKDVRFKHETYIVEGFFVLLSWLVTTDADARIDRRGCSYRPTRMLVTTDADEKTCSFTCIRLRRIITLQAQ